MNIAEKIKKIRKSKGLSQQNIADIISMNRVQYTRIETSKSDPTITTLNKIAKALEVELIDLLSEQDSFDIDSKNKTLVEKLRLIEQLNEEQKNSIYTIIDTAVSNKRFKDNLATLLEQ